MKALGLCLVRWSWFGSGSYFLFTGESVTGALFFVVAFLQRIAEAMETVGKRDEELEEKYEKLSIAHRWLKSDHEKLKEAIRS